MRKFLICLAPAAFCFITVIILGLSHSLKGPVGDTFFVIWGVCIVLGAVLSGSYAGNGVYKTSTFGEAGKLTVGILSGIAVTFGYAVLVFGGCCAIGGAMY